MEITSAERAYQVLQPLMQSDVEEFWALALGPKKELLRVKMLFRGTVDHCPMHPRDVFRFACLENASALLIAHNHPSRDLLPSGPDLRVTERLVSVSEWLEIPILDHLIVTVDGFSSFARNRWCRFPTERIRPDVHPDFTDRSLN
ncbi:MAG: JAB domain-containing protein [Bdellovibrionaceae bacterium]|nr:JAB domain-containing protein [Pseudobdellovibrionaceae bacterium]